MSFLSRASLALDSISPSSEASKEVEGIYPRYKIGTLTYFQYGYEQHNKADKNAFDITRAYLDLKADVSEKIKFRLTPDIGTHFSSPAKTNYDGSQIFRLKFAFLEFETLSERSRLFLGLHPTPWLAFEEKLNRYRLQGTMFAEREGFIPGSADYGIGYIYEFPQNFGEINLSLVNGEGFKSQEEDKFKSIQTRATIKPILGLALTGFYEYGYYKGGGPKDLFISMLSLQQRYLTVSAQYLNSFDKKIIDRPCSRAIGGSLFLEVKPGGEPEGIALFSRLDYLDPDTNKQNDGHLRQIYGIAYWMFYKNVKIGFALDDEQVIYESQACSPYEHRLLAQNQIAF